MEIADKVVIITGAGSGIGRVMAVSFGRKGARVVCCGRRYARLEETAHKVVEQGGTALPILVDVTQYEQVKAAVATAEKEFGGVHALINNAASFYTLGAVWEVDLTQWWEDIVTNLKGPMHFCHAVLPIMIAQKQGVIINITAQAGTAPKPGCSAYASSKAGLINFTNTLASELIINELPILVFGLDPGFNLTDMTENLGQMAKVDFWLPGLKASLENVKGTEPEEVAETALELFGLDDMLLSGRTFRVGMTADYIREHSKEIKEKDLLTLRFRHLVMES